MRIEGTQEVNLVETDQHRKMNMKDLDPREEGRPRPKPNDKLQKIHIGVVAERFCIHRARTARAHEGRTHRSVKKEWRSFHMGTQRYAQDRSEGYLPQTGNKSKGLTFGTEKEKA